MCCIVAGFGRYGVYSLLPGDVYAAPRYAAAPTQYHSLLPPTHKGKHFYTYSRTTWSDPDTESCLNLIYLMYIPT